LPTSTTAPATSTTSPNYSNAAPAGYSGVAPEGQRSAVIVQGYHDFKYGDFTLTAYGCFRSNLNNRVLCDFDASRQTSGQLGANIWGGIALVDDGGKVTARHDAFFLFDDGSQAPSAYLSPKPVRMIMEFDDINPRFTAVSLVSGQDRATGIPITMVDASQGGMAIPARGGAAAAAAQPAQGQQAQGQQPAAPGTAAPGTPTTATNATDKASQAVANANDKKAKAMSLWQQLKAAAQSQSQPQQQQPHQ
jgi:hypothetical protein